MNLTRTARCTALACASLAAAWLPVAASAGVFSVVPVRILFGPRDRAVAVTLTNMGDTPVALNAELYAWQQRPDGTDQLTPTEDLILAPPLIRLQPKAQQVVRLALLRAADPQAQLAYRMIVREVPSLAAQPPASMNIPVALALNLPVFVTPPNARWEVDCASARTAAGAEVRCVNKGNAAAVVRSAEVEKDGAVLARFEGGAYLLPGTSRPLPLEPRIAAVSLPAKLTLTFEDDHRAVFALPPVD